MQTTPYALVSQAAEVRTGTKRELIGITRRLERGALEHAPEAAAAALQDVRFLTERTRTVYARLAEAGAVTRLHARGLQAWVAPGVEGVALDDDDPLVDEWVLVLPGPDPVVLAAADSGDTGCADDDRTFRWGLSGDPHVVAACGRLLGI